MSNRRSTNGSEGDIMDKDFSNGNDHLDADMDSGNALNRIRTAGSISISPELFEKLYLSPQNKIAGDLRKKFGNPTPVALIGFLMSLTPLSNVLLGWRGAGGDGASGIASYFFFGGLLAILGGVGEWILGNTFSSVVFTSFGAFWLTFGGTLQPFFDAYGFYSKTGTAAGGLENPQFYASFAFFLVYMGVLCFLYAIAALRTNIIFFLIFTLLVPAFCCVAASFWYMAEGNMAMGSHFLKAAGGISFAINIFGWYLFFGILLASVDFPFVLPVGDLSTVIKGASDRAKAKKERLARSE